MKALVGVKRAIDYAVKIRIRPDKMGVVTANVKHSINPFDELAVEEALKLHEKGVIAEVIAVTIGPKKADTILHTALAMGAHRGIHVVTGDEVDVQPLAIAKVLSHLVKEEKPEIVLLGKQAIDDDSNQTAQMLAGLLGYSQGTFLSKLDKDGSDWVISREIDGGSETLRLKSPSVVSCDLRLNTPRYATLPNIMKAKKKPIRSVTIEELKLDVEPRLQILGLADPPTRSSGIKVNNVDELVESLKSKGFL